MHWPTQAGYLGIFFLQSWKLSLTFFFSIFLKNCKKKISIAMCSPSLEIFYVCIILITMLKLFIYVSISTVMFPFFSGTIFVCVYLHSCVAILRNKLMQGFIVQSCFSNFPGSDFTIMYIWIYFCNCFFPVFLELLFVCIYFHSCVCVQGQGVLWRSEMAGWLWLQLCLPRWNERIVRMLRDVSPAPTCVFLHCLKCWYICSTLSSFFQQCLYLWP